MDCPICLNPVIDDDEDKVEKKIYTAPCGHMFHEDCYERFETYNKNEIYDHRKSKFLQIGRDQGFSQSSSSSDGGLSYKESDIEKLKLHLNKNKYVYGGLALVAIGAIIALLS